MSDLNSAHCATKEEKHDGIKIVKALHLCMWCRYGERVSCGAHRVSCTRGFTKTKDWQNDSDIYPVIVCDAFQDDQDVYEDEEVSS